MTVHDAANQDAASQSTDAGLRAGSILGKAFVILGACTGSPRGLPCVAVPLRIGEFNLGSS